MSTQNLTGGAVLTAVLDYITGSAQEELFAPITIGKLPKGEAISAEIVTDTAESRYLSGGVLMKTQLLFLFRHGAQRQALQTARAVQAAVQAAFGNEAAIHEALNAIYAQDLSYVATDGVNHIYALTVILVV
jgi:hypothetical protein